jgi:hypothetical protein
MIPQTSTSRLQKGYSILFLALPFFAMATGDTFQDDTNDLAAPAPILTIGTIARNLFCLSFFAKQNETIKY